MIEAIQYVYEAALRAINDGKTVDEAVHSIQLPERLASGWHLG